LIVDVLGQRLMAPELVEEFIRALQNEINLQRRENDARDEAKRRQLGTPVAPAWLSSQQMPTVGVAMDRVGGLLVADDFGNVVWRVTPTG
jgi:glucose/arabinose dehydrogenase